MCENRFYASGSVHSKSFGLQLQLLRALAVVVAKPGSKAMLLTPNNSANGVRRGR